MEYPTASSAVNSASGRLFSQALGWLLALCFALLATTAGAQVTISSTLGSPASGAGYTTATGTQTGRVTRNGVISTCLAPKAFPGLNTATGTRTYDAYTFTNTSASAQCVAVTLATSGINLFAVAYNNSGFVAASPGSNYLADAGGSNAVTEFSFRVPAGESYTVVVHEVNTGGGAGATYTLTVGPESPPTVSAITPDSGPTAGGTSVVITGTGFFSGDVSQVGIGGVPATNVNVINPTTINATTPAGTAGLKDVTVTTAAGSGTGTGLFCYGPCVATISPSTGPLAGGTAVTITGIGFTGATGVTIGGVAAANIVVVDAHTLTATTPAGTAGARDVIVTTPDGTGTGVGLFTYLPVPTLSAISPVSGPLAGGTAVTLTGTGFTSATALTFGGVNAASFVVVNDTTITAVTPANAAGAQPVIVVTPGGSSAPLTFTYLPVPTVSAVSPNVGPLAGGTVVTITGTGFFSGAGVTVGGAAATGVTVIDATTIQATTPAGAAGTRDVALTTPGGTGIGVGLFTYQAVPTLSAISPASGPVAGGTPVTLTGTGFTSATALTFGGVNAASFVVVNDTTITAVTPPGTPGLQSIIVVTPGGTSASNVSFSYMAPVVPAPVLSPLSLVLLTAMFLTLLPLIRGRISNRA